LDAPYSGSLSQRVIIRLPKRLGAAGNWVVAAMGRRGGKIGGKTPYADHDGRVAERRGPESL